MRTLRPERFSAVMVRVICTLIVCVLPAAIQSRSGLGQAPSTPSAPREVAEFFVRVLTAKRVDVKTLLASNATELPFFRVRLYVGPSVSVTAWRGVDYRTFRESRGARADVIELAAPQGSFRARLDELLRDPRAMATDPEETGARVVDVWCRHSGSASGHVPLMAKVIDAKDRQTGRICHDWLPHLVECMRLLDPVDALEEQDAGPWSAAPDAVEVLANGLEARRAEVASLLATPPVNSVTASHIPGGVSVEISDVRNVPVTMLQHDHTTYRSLPTGEWFIGLASDSPIGSATISFELPFPLGGGAVRAPATISDGTSIVDVDVSADGMEWTRLYRLDATTMQDAGVHALPESMLGATTIMVRARLTAPETMAVAARDVGLRFLPADLPVTTCFRLKFESDVLRVLRRENPPAAEQVPMRLVVQPKRVDAESVLEMVNAGPPEVDVYAACDLDDAVCRAVGSYAGVMRFWAAPDWQSLTPDRARAMVAGPGVLVFPRLTSMPPECATAFAGGKKSLGFPGVRDPGPEVLTALATCSLELGLDGVETLSPELVAAIGSYGGPALSLAGLRRVDLAKRPTDAVLRAVVASSGTCTLTGFTEVDEATALLLAAGQKHLALDSLTGMSPTVAAGLSRARKGLSLNGIMALDPDAAGALLTFSGESLSLAGLRTVACRLENLPTAPGAARSSLQRLLLSPPATEGESGATAEAYREELQALVGQLMKSNLCDESQREQWLARAAESTVAMKEVVESIRKEHPRVPLPPKVWIDPPITTPLDACVRTPGVFELRPPAGAAAVRGRLSREAAKSLARGLKHLDLDALPDGELTPEVAAALASSSKVVSLDGLTALEKEIVEPLAKYEGPLLSLANVAEVDAVVGELILPLFKEHRVSLPRAGLVDVAELRDFVNARREKNMPETPAQKKVFSAFLDRSKRQEWSTAGRGPKFRGSVLQLFPGEVEFELAGGQRIQGARARLMPANQATLDKLQECAKEIVGVRKEDMFGESILPGAQAAP